jgi:hypothetical protein
MANTITLHQFEQIDPFRAMQLRDRMSDSDRRRCLAWGRVNAPASLETQYVAHLLGEA